MATTPPAWPWLNAIKMHERKWWPINHNTNGRIGELLVSYFFSFFSIGDLGGLFWAHEKVTDWNNNNHSMFRLRVCSHFFQALVGIILRGICTATFYFLFGCFEFHQHRAKLSTSSTSLQVSTIDQFRIPTTSPNVEHQGKTIKNHVSIY